MKDEKPLAFLDEKAFANHARTIGPHGETVFGRPNGLSLTLCDERTLAYASEGHKFSVTPLQFPFSKRVALLPLGRYALRATSTTPVIVEGVTEHGVTVIRLAASEEDAEKIEKFVINGMSGRGMSLFAACCGASYRLVASETWNSFQIIYRGPSDERGWRLRDSDITLVPLTTDRWKQLRNILCDIFSIALHDDRYFENPRVIAAVEESLTFLLDEALSGNANVPASRRLTISHYNVARRVGDYINQRIKQPIYNEDICRDLGVSARVMHDAVTAVMQMSLQRYLKLQRLWAVRRALLTASNDVLVKTVALDYGFWHLARFSAEYIKFFGESPSETRRKRTQTAPSMALANAAHGHHDANCFSRGQA